MNANASTADSLEANRNGAHRADSGQHKDPSELNKLVADIEDLLKRAAHAADVDVSHLRERVAGKLGSAKSALMDGGRRIGATARDAAGATDDYVRASPWQSVGIAALVGAAVGFLVARR